jgi:hypothetical protein
MPSAKRGQTDADFCREMGWEVGQRLIGDEGYGPAIIEITAIGKSSILARNIHEHGWESQWTLRTRDWQPAPPPHEPEN